MSDLLNSIKLSILGSKSNNIDKEIDNSFQSIEKYSIDSDKNKYVEIMKNLISSTGSDSNSDILNSFQSIPQPQQFDQSGRLRKYQEYDMIIEKIAYCKRALNTLVDNILAPDDITKRSVQYVQDDTSTINDSNTETALARCKKIEKRLKIDKKIRGIIRTTLSKGDDFVEILVSPRGQNALTVLQENKKYSVTDEIYNFSNKISESVSYTDENNKTDSINAEIQLEYSSFSGSFMGDKSPAPKSNKFQGKFSDSDKDTEEKIQLKDIFITTHDPKYIIRLETERFKSCLGYLVFPKIDTGIVQNSSLLTSAANSVDHLCQSILTQVEKKLKTSNDNITLSDDLRKVVLQHLSSIKQNKDLKVRYVPPELMIHWRMNYEKNDPYGESIFECVSFDCKLLMALKTAKTIKDLNSATDKRVISVETGLPRDAKNIVESIKESISKRKISIDKMGSVDTIPSQIPTFETIYIPMRDGKKFVEIDNHQWGQNSRDDIDTLKFIRDNIVANLNVPAAHVGLEENMSNRSLLTVENINFCRTIISYQQELSEPLTEIFQKVMNIVYPNSASYLDYISATFPEPKISPYEHQMEYVEQMQRLIEALSDLDIPREWLKKKYLPHIDWKEVEKFNAKDKIDKELGEGSGDSEEQMGNMGGMY